MPTAIGTDPKANVPNEKPAERTPAESDNPKFIYQLEMDLFLDVEERGRS